MKPALLLVDLQQDYLASPGLQPPGDALVARAAALLNGCRDRGLPVMHIWTTVNREDDRRLPHWRQAGRWICVRGTAGHKPPPALQPVDGEAIVHKTGFNAFAGGDLDAALRRAGCDMVIIAGLHLHACVRAAATECLERGYRVKIAEDVVASNDPIHSAATRRWLTERCAVFESGAAILARLDGSGVSALVHRSPRCTSQELFEVPVPGAEEVAAAAATAQSAWKGWQQTSRRVRAALLERVAGGLDAAAPDLARQMALELGKPLAHGFEEVHRAAMNVRDVAQRASARPRQRRGAAGKVRYEPLGLIAMITPWNNPVAIPAGKIAPALVYGNTVVWKPAPAATQVARSVLRILHEAGVPKDTVRLLTGDGATARQLAANPKVEAVTFTGSLQSGYAMQEICAKRMVPLQAELNGNNGVIVWDDSDFAQAAGQVAWGAFAFAGQRCTSSRRVIVEAPRWEGFLEELTAAANRLGWGDPLEESTEIGPVIDVAKRDEVAAIVAQAQAKGAARRLVLPHASEAALPWVKAGAYARPAIICCDDPEDPLVQEETMGPVLIVQRAGDFEQALALCNGVRYGLVASLFSRSRTRQRQFLEEARAGVLKINAATAGVDATLPFGGWKASGIGPPEHGEADRLFYTRMQAVYGVTGKKPEEANAKQKT